MMETPPPLSEGTPLDPGLRALCGGCGLLPHRRGPGATGARAGAGRASSRRSGSDPRRHSHWSEGPLGRPGHGQAALKFADAGDCAHERRAHGFRRPQSVGPLPHRRSDQPRRPGSDARRSRSRHRRAGAAYRSPDRRRRRRSAPVRHALVPAHYLALSPPARPCPGRVAVRTDFWLSRRRCSSRWSSTRC